MQPYDIQEFWVLRVTRKSKTTEICFQGVPTREDFLAIVKRTPWMVVWEEFLIPAIKKVKWPTPKPGYKASYVDLKKDGIQIGSLRIERRDLWLN